jgi:SAM-dependent methyltransferase
MIDSFAGRDIDMDRRSFLTLAAVALPLGGSAPPASGFDQAPSKEGDEFYQPAVGQPGKDVVWVPTPDALVQRMLEQAKVGPEDLLFDLGCGDGKIPIAAAKQFGAIAKGIEYEPDLAALARRNAERAGVADKVEIITGDIFDPQLRERFMRATVVTMYLLPNLNLRLRPSLLAMRPGTRIVSHAFHMSDWEPDVVFSAEGREAFFWLVPANAAGRWKLRADGGWEGTIDLTQRFQRVGGTLRIKGRSQPLLGPDLRGDVLGFTFVDSDGKVRTVRATMRGDRLEGTLRYARLVTPLTGQRQPGAR